MEVLALRGVDASLAEGELAVMLGPSGSGKSIFLNILGGLDTATSGTVLFRGRDHGADWGSSAWSTVAPWETPIVIDHRNGTFVRSTTG